jgi:hypothetical protein
MTKKRSQSAGDRLEGSIPTSFDLTAPELELLAKVASVADRIERVEAE